MFDGRYLDLNQKRIKGILEFYGPKKFFLKKILDLGCGHGDTSGVLYRLGADITAVDARQEHLKIAQKKYTGIKTIKANLDADWIFKNKQFDIVLDFDLICHLQNFETHLRDVCGSTMQLMLETAVCDSDDPFKSVPFPENKSVYDLSMSGMGCFPTAAAIERVLTECGMTFRRQDDPRYNSGAYQYDWKSQNDGKCSVNNRRLWFALKRESPIQFAKPKENSIVSSGTPANNIINYKTKELNNSGNELFSPKDIFAQRNTSVQKSPPTQAIENKRFVIVIPSYNNSKWCEQNIQSAINQNYDNYRIMFTDDSSKDDTFDKVASIVNRSVKSDKISLKRNTVRVGALENLYNMITSCDDDEIILTLDGDDWLAHNDVLNVLNKYYSEEDIWMTYGQYKNYPDGGIGIAKQIPARIIASNSFRQYDWCASHLRTFYTWLFKKIKVEDLKYDGKFITSAWDACLMYSPLEMAGTHSKFISDILYIYNLDNPINDHKVDVKLQQWFDHYIRNMPKYTTISKPQVTKTKVGLLLIATGKYDRFLNGIISSADRFFLNGNYDVTYFVFSDKNKQIKSKRKIENIPIEHKPFPFASMDRFKHFTKNADKLAGEDYLYYVDVDCLFVDVVGKEIIGDLVSVRHCGYINSVGPYETNKLSTSYVDPSKYTIYRGGGFQGGKKDNYLHLSKWCYDALEKDIINNIIPIWHDESILNRYLIDNEPDINLSPSYHYPQSNTETYKQSWLPNVWQPKILLLDKNHEEIRK